MKVIFLDIDGVLNSHQYLSGTHLENRGIYQHIDPQKIALLKEIITATGAEIILSSSWRMTLDDALQASESGTHNLLLALEEYGLKLSGKTAYLNDKRGSEIRQWLAKHPKVDAFVILDDDYFDWNELAEHWVKTSYYIGLTKREAAKAIALLLPETNMTT